MWPLIVGIAALALLASPSTGPESKPSRLTPGIWISEGNAELWVISGDRFTSYNVSRASCVVRDSGSTVDLVGKSFPALEWSAKDRMIVHGYDYRYALRRIERMPDPCGNLRDSSDPFYTFDAFWQYFEDNYISFEQRHIDWHAIRTRERARVRARMSETELYALLGGMVEMINDPHVFLSNGQHGTAEMSFGSPDPHGIAAAVKRAHPQLTTEACHDSARRLVAEIDTAIRADLLHGRASSARRNRLVWGMLDDEVGYLRSAAAYGLFDATLTRDQMYAALEATLDTVFTDLGTAKALVLDVALNTGGANFVMDAIARRVIASPLLAYRVRPRTPGGAGEALEQWLEPARGPRFAGPVVVLISSNTVSAGETLPFDLRGAPGIVLFGERTLGATGSFVVLRLPNGGSVGLPNEYMTDRSGRSFEVVGIPPDTASRVFDPTAPVAGYLDFIRRGARLASDRAKAAGR